MIRKLYNIMLIKLKLIENNIEPIITFHHFTTPEWVFNEDHGLT